MRISASESDPRDVKIKRKADQKSTRHPARKLASYQRLPRSILHAISEPVMPPHAIRTIPVPFLDSIQFLSSYIQLLFIQSSLNAGLCMGPSKSCVGEEMYEMFQFHVFELLQLVDVLVGIWAGCPFDTFSARAFARRLALPILTSPTLREVRPLREILWIHLESVLVSPQLIILVRAWGTRRRVHARVYAWDSFWRVRPGQFGRAHDDVLG